MKRLLALVAFACAAAHAPAAVEVVESIPNQNGGWSTLYDQNSAQCKGSNFFADATDGEGRITGKGCWQHYADGYLIFVTEGSGAGEFIHLSRAAITQIKLAHAAEHGGDLLASERPERGSVEPPVLPR